MPSGSARLPCTHCGAFGLFSPPPRRVSILRPHVPLLTSCIDIELARVRMLQPQFPLSQAAASAGPHRAGKGGFKTKTFRTYSASHSATLGETAPHKPRATP